IGGSGVGSVVAPGFVREYGIEMPGGLEAVGGPEYAGTALPVRDGAVAYIIVIEGDEVPIAVAVHPRNLDPDFGRVLGLVPALHLVVQPGHAVPVQETDIVVIVLHRIDEPAVRVPEPDQKGEVLHVAHDIGAGFGGVEGEFAGGGEIRGTGIEQGRGVPALVLV